MSIHRVFLLAIIAVAVLTTSCASQHADVRTDHDPNASFDGYTTYAWIEVPDDYDGWRPPEHLDIRLRRVVDDTLEAKGFQKAPVLPMADLLLVYYASVDSELRVTSTPYGYYPRYAYGYWHGARYGTTQVRRFASGTVVLDIIDHKKKQLVWTGQVTSAIKRKNPPSDRMATVAEQLLQDFPPQ